ncbi:DsbA family protein [Streptomyces sp. NPDC018031]|uniref:DsbA family protein n=1 Tax=Streptomyces sp. NPDC018031 TaxID=3365033 RepID=UPI0037AD7A5C
MSDRSDRSDSNPGGDDARARLRAQQDRDRAREKRRRVLIVAVLAVAVLGAAALIGVLVSGDDDGEPAGPVTAPKGATGKDDLVIRAGPADAPATLTVYEDFRCPACKQFEDTFRGTIHDLQDAGRLRTDYRLVTIIDGNLGGSGSLDAANAAACAQDAGRFTPYHDVLYTNQPPESDDAFADEDTLIGLAGQVDGLDTETFRSCVRRGLHESWVRKSVDDFSGSGFDSTPTVLLDGEEVYGDPDEPLTPRRLRQLVDQAARD